MKNTDLSLSYFDDLTRSTEFTIKKTPPSGQLGGGLRKGLEGFSPIRQASEQGPRKHRRLGQYRSSQQEC